MLIVALGFAVLFLLWLGYALFLRPRKGGRVLWQPAPAPQTEPLPAPGFRRPGAPAKICPVCGAELGAGELVKSTTFPTLNGSDSIMHIRGCAYCLTGIRDRLCPVCHAVLKTDEVLMARMFNRADKNHVHVLGCSRCRG
jgi:hypothetical protein